MSKRNIGVVHIWCVKCAAPLSIHDGHDTCTKCAAKKRKARAVLAKIEESK